MTDRFQEIVTVLVLPPTVLDSHCGLAATESFCTTFAVLLGAGAGIVLAIKQLRFGARASSLLAAGAIAGLAAALGCVRLGVFGLASMLVGIALGALLGATMAKRAA